MNFEEIKEIIYSRDIDEIKEIIFSRKNSKGNGKFFRKVAFELEYSMLGEENFPVEIFLLYMEILSDKDLLKSKGTFWFLFHIYNDFDKIGKEQLDNLKQIIVESYKYNYEEKLKLVALDIFLRKMSPKDIFDMQRIAKSLNLSDENNDIVYGINEMFRRYTGNNK
ncbi:hypothetical protein [Acinetobacter larvae]|uniref:Immunity protein 30 domain-containing protein n=1 Tax=Acinetobacter larvae TaxID=1789224 RepID=A0A1B2M306_9GAMM|nr:hypothetical protein [Acinetobacter larvae]AOA59572.1 hypothetical protein BFG52_15285 [Acinetobacter larvae]